MKFWLAYKMAIRSILNNKVRSALTMLGVIIGVAAVISAVGIARTFAYGGAKGRKLYDDEEEARFDMTLDEYRTKSTASVTHFYEKLLRLKDLMVTAKGQQMAEARHAFMVQFLDQLKKERDGIL